MTSEPIILHIDGHQLAAVCLNTDASGQPVILLHGITSSLYAWAIQPPCVLAQGPCYSLSLPGHFPAIFPADLRPQALTAETIAHVLVAAIRELVGDRPVTLIGHSTGGFAALALTGDRDPIVPPAQAQQIAGLVKRGELAVIAGAGHLPFAERATEYNAILTQWLTHTFVL
jgi:pimeloyl-ACP methyl ester carboxylesterase